MDPSQGEKTTMDREILEPSEGEWTKDLISKAKVFLENYFSVWAEAAKKLVDVVKELAEARKWPEMMKLANLYLEDSWMKFNGENIQGKEAIRAKLTSCKPSRIQVLNTECLPVGASGFYGMVCGYIWLDGKQEARFFSQTFSLHPTPEGSFAISNSIFIHIGMETCGAGTFLGSSTRPFP